MKKHLLAIVEELIKTEEGNAVQNVAAEELAGDLVELLSKYWDLPLVATDTLDTIDLMEAIDDDSIIDYVEDVMGYRLEKR